jgi:hypothetical protein
MPNAIKYNVSAETLALKKGNFWIGTGDVGKGPTSSTGYYNGTTPPSGGYTIYLNKETGGPSIYTVTTEAQIVSLTNSIGSQNFTTSGQCLNWFATQTDKMIFNRDYEDIITNGLVMNLDAGFTPSYPTTATTWYDVSSGGNNGALTNGPTFNSGNGGSIVFDGVDDYATVSSLNLTGITENFTFITVIKFPTFNNGGAIVWQAFSSYWALMTNTSFGAANLTFTTRGTRGQAAVSSTLTANQWYYVVCKREAGVNSLYINNTIYTYTSDVSSPGGTLFKIGTDGNNNYFFNGNLALIQLYNRALTQTEIMQNYNAQKSRFGL